MIKYKQSRFRLSHAFMTQNPSPKEINMMFVNILPLLLLASASSLAHFENDDTKMSFESLSLNDLSHSFEKPKRGLVDPLDLQGNSPKDEQNASSSQAKPGSISVKVGIETDEFSNKTRGLLQEMKRLKVAVTGDPSKLNTVYPSLQKEFLKLSAESSELKASGHTLSDNVTDALRQMKIICEMLELNIKLRGKGCSDYELGFAPDQDSLAHKKTIVETILERIKTFENEVSGCYDRNGYPDTANPHLEAMIENVKTRYMDLNTDCKPLLEGFSPLKQLITNEIHGSYYRIEELEFAEVHNIDYSRRRKAPAQVPHNIDGSSLENSRQQRMKEIENTLRSFLNSDPQSNEALTHQSVDIWRSRTRGAFYQLYEELMSVGIEEAHDKMAAKSLLKSIKRVLNKNANKVALEAISMCIDPTEPDRVSLGRFREIQNLLKADIDFTSERVRSIARSLEHLQTDLPSLNKWTAIQKLRLHELLLKELSEDCEQASFQILAEAEETKGLLLETMKLQRLLKTVLRESEKE